MPETLVHLPHADKVNLVGFTDVHLAACPPGRRKASYLDEILDKLYWTAGLTAKVKGAGICGGDLYHVKNPKSPSNPHAMNTRIIGAFQEFPEHRVYGVVGNHDVTGDNLNTIPSQPIGGLIQAGVYWRLGVESVIFQAQNGLRVLVDGYDYLNKPELLEAVHARKEDLIGFEQHQLDWEERPYHYAIAVVHAFNKPGATEMMFDKDIALGWDDLDDTGYDAFFWGHDHARRGIQKTEKGVWHVQLGSLARAAWAKDEIERPVSVVIFSASREGLKIAEMEVPVRPLELSFHTADISIDKVDRREDVSGFMKDLDSQVQAVDSDDPSEILASITEDPAIIDTVKSYCEIG